MIFGADKEKAIISAYGRGDPGFVDRLYAEYADYLAGVCSRYIADDDDMKDVLQEAFIRIVSKMDSFSYRGKGSLRAWITRVTVNECLQFLKKKKKEPETLDESYAANVPDADPDVKGLSFDTLTGLIRRLPEGYRQVLNLYAIEGKSHREIGEMLHIKPDSSASQFHRAKNMLARMIAEEKKNTDC